MKVKNRRGSTLALTLIVFAVLMILGTAILGLMVNENKMSINHQNKTQAYYLARSGAVAVEAAVLDIYNKKDNTEEIKLFDELKGFNEKTMNVKVKNNMEAEVLMKLASIPGDTDNFLLNIKSQSTVGNSSQTVEKVLRVPKPVNKPKVEVESPIVYIDKINPNIEEINKLKEKNGESKIAEKATKIYELYKFNPENFPEEKKSTLPTGPLSGNYYIETLNGIELNNRVINGKVNIYVKDKYVFNASSNLNINLSGKAENLNIYVYSGGASLKADNGTKVSINSNLYVKSGQVNMDFHKLEYNGNIVLGDGVNMSINVDDNGGSEHVNIKGLIYGPTSTINLGDDKKGALSVTGGIVGKIVNYNYKVNNLSQSKIFKVQKGDGIDNPLELEETVVTTIEKGYFK